MIYALHNLFKKRLSIDPNINIFYVLLAGIGYFYINKSITITTALWSISILGVLYLGVFNTPYLFLRNSITIWTCKRFFKKNNFLFEEPHRIISLRKKKESFWDINSPIGVVFKDTAYIDEYYQEHKCINTLKKFYEITFFDKKNDLLKEIKEEDDEDIIAKKIILFNLKRTQ